MSGATSGISVLDAGRRPKASLRDGRAWTVLSPAEDGTRVEVAFREINGGRTHDIGSGGRTQVAYLIDGTDITLTHTTGGTTTTHAVRARCGVYLEPGEDATVTTADPLTLLIVSVPKYHGRAAQRDSPVGYVFDESHLRAFVDERLLRERTFWVNTETGLSDSWDLQIGRMRYVPDGYSPRHVHHPSATSLVTPEHFYLIERGRGEVRHDQGALPVGPGSLVLIPAGEWHQLVASETGLDYIEFQAPFDFETTMNDPRGKHWYIKGTDDGTGRPKPWIQS